LIKVTPIIYLIFLPSLPLYLIAFNGIHYTIFIYILYIWNIYNIHMKYIIYIWNIYIIYIVLGSYSPSPFLLSPPADCLSVTPKILSDQTIFLWYTPRNLKPLLFLLMRISDFLLPQTPTLCEFLTHTKFSPSFSLCPLPKSLISKNQILGPFLATWNSCYHWTLISSGLPPSCSTI
jgi:hypothetical protein